MTETKWRNGCIVAVELAESFLVESIPYVDITIRTARSKCIIASMETDRGKKFVIIINFLIYKWCVCINKFSVLYYQLMSTGNSRFTQFWLCDFAFMQLENLHHFSNACNNFRFNAIWHRHPWSLFSNLLDNFQLYAIWDRWSVVMVIFCRNQAGSDITVRYQSCVRIHTLVL
jgi:hypothetical protein